MQYHRQHHQRYRFNRTSELPESSSKILNCSKLQPYAGSQTMLALCRTGHPIVFSKWSRSSSASCRAHQSGSDSKRPSSSSSYVMSRGWFDQYNLDLQRKFHSQRKTHWRGLYRSYPDHWQLHLSMYWGPWQAPDHWCVFGTRGLQRVVIPLHLGIPNHLRTRMPLPHRGLVSWGRRLYPRRRLYSRQQV